MQEFHVWTRRIFLGLPATSGYWQPAVDVCEDDEAVHIVVEIAGVNQSELEVTYQPDGTLVVRGVRRPLLPNPARCLVLEIAYGTFERRIPLPANIDADGITASYKAGMLHIRIPKASPTRTVRVQP